MYHHNFAQKIILIFVFMNIIPVYTAARTETEFIIMISVPTIPSMVFLRMMQASEVCHTIAEPGADAYFAAHGPQLCSCWDYEPSNMPKNYEEAVKCIEQFLSQSQPVFMKEVGFAAQEYLLQQGKHLLCRPQTRCIFLICHPLQALLTYHNFEPHEFDVESIMNYQNLYHLYNKISEVTGNAPRVIMTDDIIKDAHNTIEMFFEYINIPFSSKFLSWNQQDSSISAQHLWDINTQKHGWFDVAFSSNDFSSLTVDEQESTFSEIHDKNLREKYQNLYQENMKYYRLFQENARMQVEK